jgi:predicted GNAT superfamily acetyltransferase
LGAGNKEMALCGCDPCPMIEMSQDLVASAADAAVRAADRSGVTVREIHDLDGEAAVSHLFDRVWGAGGEPVLPANLIHAISHAGNYLAGAFHGDRIIGAAFGFLGQDDHGIYLHSHMTGVDPSSQKSGIGFALKLHQRAWALNRGLDRVEWTFDPLVRRNSYFNLVKLGAQIVDYHVNFYGDMVDGINVGDESDRVVVSWDLASQRVIDAAEMGLPEPDFEQWRNAGALVALDYDENHRPLAAEGHAPLLLCHIPEDVVELRKRDPDAALDWRRALRSTFGVALQNGHKAKAITRNGWYVLEQEGAA